MYGHLDGQLRNEKILVESLRGCPLEIQSMIVSELHEHHCDAVTEGELMLPGINYRNEEKQHIIDSLKIKYIIIVGATESTGTYHVTQTNANAFGGATTTSGTAQYLAGMQIDVNIFTSKNSFSRGVAYFTGDASPHTTLSTSASLSRRIINNIFRELEKERAFKKKGSIR